MPTFTLKRQALIHTLPLQAKPSENLELDILQQPLEMVVV